MRIHPEMLGNQVGLVDAAGTHAADIEFLKRDDMRVGRGDDFGDACGVGPAVPSAAAMDIIGEHAEGTAARYLFGWQLHFQGTRKAAIRSSRSHSIAGS